MVRWTANPSAGDVPPASRAFAAFIGLDKSDKKINVSLQRCGTAKIERSIIKGGAEALHAWVATLCTRFAHRQVAICLEQPAAGLIQDRKSTRLNSSHANISYAV